MFIYKKMEYYNLVLITLFILFGGNRFCFALDSTGAVQDTTKIKVLVLHIIEENWDDLELALPEYDSEGDGPKPITKRETLIHYEEYKGREENTGINEARSFRGFTQDKIITAKDTTFNRFLILKGTFAKGTKLYVNHNIRYYGKTYLLKDEDTFMKDALRIHNLEFGYFYNQMPEKIEILTKPDWSYGPEKKQFDGKFIPPYWDGFEEIRLVEDIYFVSSDEVGNLKIKYDGKEYILNVETMIELPVKEADLTKDEMMKFRERYYEYYSKIYTDSNPKDLLNSKLSDLSIVQNSFHFGTKLTLSNMGYIEVEIK